MSCFSFLSGSSGSVPLARFLWLRSSGSRVLPRPCNSKQLKLALFLRQMGNSKQLKLALFLRQMGNSKQLTLALFLRLHLPRPCNREQLKPTLAFNVDALAESQIAR